MSDAGLFDTQPAVLVLEDGTTFRGEAVCGGDATFGEVVFNTSLVGYQEVISDPSYAGQLVTMTYPHIGNYGANAHDDESRRPAAEGIVLRDLSAVTSNHRSEESFTTYLARNGLTCITGVDTRRLTRHIRSEGAMTGGIFSGVALDKSPAELTDAVRESPAMEGRDLASVVTAGAPYVSPERPAEARYRVALVDFGVKRTILRRLAAAGCDVTVFPAGTSADDLLAHGGDGVMLSNGPGDPAAVAGAPATLAALLGNVPVFGICLGHQILGLTLGARTFKLPFGHHGANHPVLDVETGRIEITSQNHGFSVALDDGAETPFGKVDLTHRNLNDDTLEGLACRDVAAFSVQYHPEAGPGPHDAAYLFERFTKLMDRGV
ncbi:MAG: glutamine-hydrolyzing carbamoyl-phosphate synthase small subunit [Acidimicrobiia bacterium]|nr:glutamine-hydrolyzing carbamoyl-phosphate synthase small subunit [Acidimicrobiia bacterium]